MNYLVTTARANTNLEKNIAASFGVFQTATRRSIASENFDSDVLEDFYDSEVDWAIQTNRLRQQYDTANGTAKHEYISAIRDAVNKRRTHLVNAESQYNVDVFNAEEIYAKTTAAADSARSLASFDATAAYIQSTLRAIGDKLYRNAADDAFFDATLSFHDARMGGGLSLSYKAWIM